jgi:citrate synthase
MSSLTANHASKGLEGVVATTSSICYIDGDLGVLAYRGIDIHELADNSTFEETCYLLWFGRLPKVDELKQLRQQLGAERKLDPAIINLLRTAPKQTLPMDVLRTAVSALSFYDPEDKKNDHDANVHKAIRLTSQIAMIVAAYDRLRKGKSVVEADPSLSHSANFLLMLNGTRPSQTAERALDIALILHADHELNASTFAARVTAATLSDMHSAITSAIGALKGPLHGGANEAAMSVLAEVGTADRAEAWVKKALAEKRRIMGFGHRVYKDGDPRAVYLKRLTAAVAAETGHQDMERMADIIETAVLTEKKLPPNVDWPCARLYHYLGLATDLYTPLFVAARVVGWSAHIFEQLDNNRLIRPRGLYTGPAPRQWKPFAQR